MNKFELLFEIPYYQLEKSPKEDAFCHKQNGSWRKYSTQEFVNLINKASLAFMQLDLQPGEKIAIVSNSRPEWNIVDYASLQAGLVNVPVYPTISESEYRFIFQQAEVKYAFVGDKNLYNKINSIKADVPTLKDIFCFEKIAECKSFADFIATADTKDEAKLNTIKNNIKPTDLATIIYTSGTTGNPKGVMLSHHNVVSNIRSVEPLLPIDSSMRVLSFLPLCHIFERMVANVYVFCGVSVYYAESMETIADNLKEVKPHFFTTVPRLLEKVYMKLEAAASGLEGIKKKLYIAALNFANKYDPDKEYGLLDSIKYKLFDKTIYVKWREALGGNVIGLVSGAAKLNPKLARVFTAAGILVSEGYGQTESSPVITVCPLEKGKIKFGSVGIVINDVEVKLDRKDGMAEGEGEICAKGPNIMMGYYKNEEATAATIIDGWLHTGDVGKFVDYHGQKYLMITDRVKEIFKTSGGKYIAPLSLESKMKEIPFIEQMLVIGEDRNFVSALIVPNFVALKEWCAANGVPTDSNEKMVNDPKVKKLFEDAVNEKNKFFGNWETIKKFTLLPNEWTVDTGELTPTMKVKRKVVTERYKELIENLYK